MKLVGVDIKDPVDSTRKLLDLINTLNKRARYKSQYIKLVAFHMPITNSYNNLTHNSLKKQETKT